MHGTLRFILATAVALSHLGINLYTYNIGVVSVVIFYLLAGMVSNKLLSKYFINQPLHYYLNRIKRIFPFYLYAISISILIYYIGVSSPFLSATPTFWHYISNLAIIPLAYYMYTSIDTFFLIPPAWSLGVELQFYILIPFFINRTKPLLALFILSFITYISASLGIINTDYYGYRLIVGVLFIFIYGIYIDKALKGDQAAKKIILLCYIFLLLLSFYLLFHQELKAPYNYETLLGLLLGIPLLYFFKSPIPKYIDRYLGFLSFGLFLLHFPALWLVEILGFNTSNIYLILLVTILLSTVGHYTVDRK